jgi:UDP-2-acetamido-3-amino-2,3-dideoxy-glucuronate N-acetyltransferase
MMKSEVPQFSNKLSRVAVVGAGAWGRNLVRNFFELGALAAVCDARQEALDFVAKTHAGVPLTRDFNSLLTEHPEIEAVVIAAPAAQHYELARRALLAGKDVFVEKPLALHVQEGRDLISLAAARNRILMVGHILEYHSALIELKHRIQAGELGKIRYIYSSRLNLGKLRTEENILWSFAPHDISAIIALLQEMPVRVSAHGGSYLDSAIADVTLSTCEFKSGVKAHIFVSWLHPFKEQRLAVVGDRKMAVFDDTEPERKLVIYSHRIDWQNRIPVARKDAGEVVPLPATEPLRSECEHFLQCIRERSRPRTDGESALRVLQVLETCEQSLKSGGIPTEIAAPADYYAHPSSVVDSPSRIGSGTKIWHFSHIMADSTIGRNCVLGQNVLVASGVRVGDNVKIQNNVSLYTGVELEDDVFCGPSMVFTNVINPRSHVSRKHEYQRTLVRRGATLGANSTIVCGNTIGQFAFIAAGAVVTRDVPDHALMIGVPAKRAGWVCSCGVRLPDAGPEAHCPECGRYYEINAESCVELAVEKPVAMAKRSGS